MLNSPLYPTQDKEEYSNDLNLQDTKPRPMNQEDIRILHSLDEIYTDN